MSPCNAYRYRLNRAWDYSKNQCAWICLNPSTADADVDDPTVRKIIGFTRRWGYGGFALFNLLALRATDPKQLLKHPNPWGEKNGPHEIAVQCRAYFSDPPIIAWGGIHQKFRRDALEMVRALSVVRCLGYTKDGQPRHPLMLPYSTKLETTDASRWIQ